MTFKDLKKLIPTSQVGLVQQTRLFERLRDKPFWIWDSDQHRLVDIKENGDCCFNHIVGLPVKDNVERPMF